MSQLLPYETIVKASEGDPEAVAAVLSHYAGYIRSCAKMDGQINTDMQEHTAMTYTSHDRPLAMPATCHSKMVRLSSCQ